MSRIGPAERGKECNIKYLITMDCHDLCGTVPAAPPPAGPPLSPLVPINILDKDGDPVRNDNSTNMGYVGGGNGSTPAEIYTAYNPANLSDPTPIQPGGTTYLKNAGTGKFCRY